MTTKRKLLIILPIASILLVAIVSAIIFFSLRVTENDYFKSIQSLDFVTKVHTTTIKEGEFVVYEKKETLTFDGSKAHHEIYEKKISNSLNQMYDETFVEYFYQDNKMYYLENDIWKEKDFNLKNNIKTYQFKNMHFSSFDFDKKFETVGTFNGNIKNEYSKTIFGNQTNYKDAKLTIIVDKDFSLQSFVVVAKTDNNRDVLISGEYDYTPKNITIPN